MKIIIISKNKSYLVKSLNGYVHFLHYYIIITSFVLSLYVFEDP